MPVGLADILRQLPGHEDFYAESGKLFSKLCVKIVGLTKRSSNDRHTETAGHINRKKSIQKQQSLVTTMVFSHRCQT